MKVLASAALIIVLALPAFAQEAPAVRERIVPPAAPAGPPAVTLEAKPETPRDSRTLMKCTRDPEAEKAGNVNTTCVEVKNPEVDKRHPDYGKPKQYPLSPPA